MKKKIKIGGLILVHYGSFLYIERVTAIREENYDTKVLLWICLNLGKFKTSKNTSIKEATHSFTTQHIFTFEELPKLFLYERKHIKRNFWWEFMIFKNALRKQIYHIKNYILLPKKIKQIKQILEE